MQDWFFFTHEHQKWYFHSWLRHSWKYSFWCSFGEIKIDLTPKKSNILYIFMSGEATNRIYMCFTSWVKSKPYSTKITLLFFLAHLSRRLTRWAYSIPVKLSSVCLSVCLCVCVPTLSNMNISAISRPIAIKFYLKHFWGGGKDALGFGPDQIWTRVSMATDSSHRGIMGNML